MPRGISNTANSRNRGNTYERQIVKELKELGYDVTTSRFESKSMDNKGVDIVSIGKKKLPFHVQCKNYSSNIKYWEILSEMPNDLPPVIFHKKTKKAKTRFITEGEYVIMSKENFYKALNV